jgi:hypothetical protein
VIRDRLEPVPILPETEAFAATTMSRHGRFDVE